MTEGFVTERSVSALERRRGIDEPETGAAELGSSGRASKLAPLRPLYDLCLVKRLPDGEREGSLFIPENIRNPERGLRRGVVVAVGDGDLAVAFECLDCTGHYSSTLSVNPSGTAIIYRVANCPNCGSDNRRALWEFCSLREMDVKVDDEVLYPRTPANDIKIEGDEYTFVHECAEGHGGIVAVLEPDSLRPTK